MEQECNEQDRMRPNGATDGIRYLISVVVLFFFFFYFFFFFFFFFFGSQDTVGLELSDILPDRYNYDKMRPPKRNGQATIVEHHFTVMGLDSIDENSMVRWPLSISHFPILIYLPDFSFEILMSLFMILISHS